MNPVPSTDELRQRVAAVMIGYQCSSLDYAVGPGRAVRVSGYVADPADIDAVRRAVNGINGIAKLDFNVGLRIWPYCEAVKILQPLIEHPPRAGASLSLSPPTGEAHLGQPLIVDVRAPSFDDYLYIDYLDSEGDVLHLFPNSRDRLNFRPARNHLVLGRPPLERCWIIGGNTGEQLLILVAATEPLFAEHRPEVESARDFLPSLARAVSQPSADGKTAAVAFFQLRDASPVGAGAGSCR